MAILSLCRAQQVVSLRHNDRMDISTVKPSESQRDAKERI